ncbi:hypothetical protein L1O03_05530 [Corynebacterium uropygiale]|uniref:Uncharacterized protein n=1 Tax=Corynebacterium uropygiale TaxID=1775911 RepID=A0A9X1QNY7_9CORY|nr:hypothetical protein [Corynebacterium uropygiale]MCF4006639.1 hypothetical protein [Corynebacterium uropygiale]
MMETFGPDVETFTADLEYFSTGGYLKEGEKEHWDAPFDPAAATQVKEILHRYLEALDAHREGAPPEDALAVFRRTHEALTQLNHEHGDAVLEQEEAKDLEAFFRATLSECGVTEENLEELDLSEA